jgi:glycerol-3-phosphate acyltransferase PlsY
VRGERDRQTGGGKGAAMDFGVILIVANTLMAVFLYIVVKLIWQE